jgi:hypothetical protein
MGARGTSVEKLHRETQARYLRFAERVRAVRRKPKPEPLAANVTPIRRPERD